MKKLLWKVFESVANFIAGVLVRIYVWYKNRKNERGTIDRGKKINNIKKAKKNT